MADDAREIKHVQLLRHARDRLGARVVEVKRGDGGKIDGSPLASLPEKCVETCGRECEHPSGCSLFGRCMKDGAGLEA